MDKFKAILKMLLPFLTVMATTVAVVMNGDLAIKPAIAKGLVDLVAALSLFLQDSGNVTGKKAE